MDYRLADRVTAAKFVVDVLIAARKIGNHKIRAIQQFNDLRGYPTRLGKKVCAAGFIISEFSYAGRHDVRDEIVRGEPDFMSRTTDRADHKTNLRQRSFLPARSSNEIRNRPADDARQCCRRPRPVDRL